MRTVYLQQILASFAVFFELSASQHEALERAATSSMVMTGRIVNPAADRTPRWFSSFLDTFCRLVI